MTSCVGKSGQVIHSQSREIIYNVYKYLRNKNPASDMNNLKGMVAEAVCVSVKSVEKIIKEGENPPSDEEKPLFSTPGKKRLRKSEVSKLEDFEKCDFRRVVHNFHRTEGCRVTLKHLCEKLNKELDWKGKTTSLRVILKDLGFHWRKTKNNRCLLIEKSDIRRLRIDYLEKITHFRDQNRPIVYIDETYIHGGHTHSKSWNDDSSEGLFTNISKGQRLVMVHAGGEMGFLPNTLLIFKSGTKSGDYHDEMNSQNYGKWVNDKLIPNLPPNSVVVIDNAPYHNVQENRAPTSNSNKSEMIRWLTEQNIQFSVNMYKPQLYELIKLNKKRFIKYKFDVMLQKHGHTVLRLPPYHPDLNPIELIWARVKNSVAKKNTTFKLNDVQKLAEEEFSSVTQENWQKCCSHAKKCEENYLNNERIIDVQTEELIISLNDSDSDMDFLDTLDYESD